MAEKSDYTKIIEDRNLFNQLVYTSLPEALKILDERKRNVKLMKKVEKLLKGHIPRLMENCDKCAVLFRQVATPNYEIKRFISIAKQYDLHPLIFEHHNDIFSPDNNEYKYSLGKMPIHKIVKGKPGSEIKEHITIVDFNAYKGKKIKDVKTLWGEPLVDFHKFLFSDYFKNEKVVVWNASELYKKQGSKNPFELYKYLFLFFIYHGILFENFLTSKSAEGDFTKTVVLPALNYVIEQVGVKPLIVPIEPIENEHDEYWMYYDNNVKQIINGRKRVKK
jgi:hypothetical protein